MKVLQKYSFCTCKQRVIIFIWKLSSSSLSAKTWLTFADSEGINQMTVFRRMQRFWVLKGELERGLPPCSTSGSFTSHGPLTSPSGFPLGMVSQTPLSLFHLKAEDGFSYWEQDSDKLTFIYEASSGISSNDKVLIQTKWDFICFVLIFSQQ